MRSGNDVLNGGTGADYLYGEAGNDYLYGGYYGSNDGTVDYLNGGSGIDGFHNDWVRQLWSLYQIDTHADFIFGTDYTL